MNEFLANPPPLHMWFTFGLIGFAIIGYANDKIAMELTSIVIITVLLVFFYIFPQTSGIGEKPMDTERILQGFANPALLAVLSLLVLGQAVVQTGALTEVANVILKIGRNNAFLSITITLVVVMVISALLNNTPVVVIFIPIIASLAKSLNRSVSRLMIPLSFASILGGMTTLIGSSTNLLVSGILKDLGMETLGFFDFTVPGLVIVSVGLVYIIFIAPKMLPDRASMVKSLVEDGESRKFVAQIEVDYDSEFIDQKVDSGGFEKFPDVNVRMIQRGEHAFLPPFDEEIVVRPRDIIIVSANRDELKGLFSSQSYKLLEGGDFDDDSEEEKEDNAQISMAEVVVAPASRMIGRNLEQIGFNREHNCIVLGIERRSKVIRSRVTEIRLAAGDVLLVMGRQQDIMAMHHNRDVLLMEWSTEDVHAGNKALLTAGIFFAVVGAAAVGFIPITISAFVGVSAILITRCINLRQAVRAIDTKIMLMIVASIALGSALQATGGAAFIAEAVIDLLHGVSAPIVMSIMFFFMMIITNLLSNNSSAVLFTPIAVNMALQLGVDPRMFIFAVIFACNCSFATPIGYQTNLLVMGPGHHTFSDFMRCGIPLAILVWLTYSFFGPWYFGYYDYVNLGDII